MGKFQAQLNARKLFAHAKMLLGVYKYHLAEQHDAIVLKPGKKGILGGFVAAGNSSQRHHKIFGSPENGYGEVVICFGDFRRGLEESEKYQKLPHLLQEFIRYNSPDISDLCGMSRHCAKAEAADFELTQLIRLARRYDARLTKVWYCGNRCTLNYTSPA